MRARCYDLRWSARIHQITSGSRACKRNSRCFTAGRKSKACTKAGAASCIVVYHNCATSAASLRIQRSFSLVSLRSGIGKRNEGISLTQCMVLGGLGSERNDLGRRSMRQTSFAAFKLSVQFKVRSRFRARYDYCRSVFFYRHRSDATGGRSIGRALALFLRVSGSRVRSAVAACQRKIAVKQEPVSLRPFSPPNL